MKSPKVFISYSHDNEQHKDWVRGLAEALLSKGIDVLLDQWDLRLGQDIHQFMASGIREVDRVLVVCTVKKRGQVRF